MSTDHYVVFCDSQAPELRLLKKGWRHCYIIRDDGLVWSVIQGGRSNLDVSYWLKTERPTVADMAGDCTAILPAPINTDQSRIMHGFNLISCVGIVKYIIGLRKGNIITPYQLYRYLKWAAQ